VEEERSRKNGKILWHMSGNGGQFWVVLPEYVLVMTKINSYAKTPYTDITKFQESNWNIVNK